MDKVEEARLRVQNARKRKEEISSKISRLKGALEEKEKTLESIRQSCIKAGIDPDNLESYMSKLLEEFNAAMAVYENGLSDLEARVSPLANLVGK